jgi:hypothetical protein
MKIQVFLRTQDAKLAQANHSATQKLADKILACGMAKKLVWTKEKKQIQLTVAATWREVKDQIRPAKIGVKVMAVVHGQPPGNLDLGYPQPGKETVIHEHAAFKRECAQARQRKKAERVAQAQQVAAQ